MNARAEPSLSPESSYLPIALVVCASLSPCVSAKGKPCAPPEPFGPVPSPRQLRWHELETYAFLHFGVNRFTNKEWGYGDESPAIFQPTDFSAEQIVSSLKAAGMHGVVLTCKHHDGFCLWPSRHGEHTVKHIPWRRGKGDVVREISDACRRNGLKFGVYPSPWDRNHKDYGRPEYITYYRNQLRELLTEYGPIFEVWFDGANGGDGYDGGARTTRHIDAKTYDDWENTWKLVRELQPEACIFSDIGPDVRWVGVRMASLVILAGQPSARSDMRSAARQARHSIAESDPALGGCRLRSTSQSAPGGFIIRGPITPSCPSAR
jgi:alpha-L-fucosidase